MERAQVGGEFLGVLVTAVAFADLRELMRRDLDRQPRNEQLDELPPRFAGIQRENGPAGFTQIRRDLRAAGEQ